MHKTVFRFRDCFLNLQDRISTELQAFEPEQRFQRDAWTGILNGTGLTATLKEGQVVEKAGVNVSCVQAQAMPLSATATRPELAGLPFFATGISLVIHPKNPHVPTTHANLRFFLVERPDGPPVWWFGGGFDLTPYYGYVDDCRHWHQMAYQACQPFGENVYPEFKAWADDYFYIKHRQEWRGIGGLFFDDLNRWDMETCFQFVQHVADHFLLAYLPIVEKRHKTVYGERERDFQLYRRGRYVEFNLVYDRGTLFGLQSGGRIESILMSLPPLVAWDYNRQDKPESREYQTVNHFLKPQDWLRVTL